MGTEKRAEYDLSHTHTQTHTVEATETWKGTRTHNENPVYESLNTCEHPAGAAVTATPSDRAHRARAVREGMGFGHKEFDGFHQT